MLSRNTYLVPSSHHNLDGIEFLLHQQPQHHQQQQQQQQEGFPSGFYLAPALNNATFFNQENGKPSFAAGFHKKQTVKKDRHSKINTAQGPRDRRVRLSINIARKFFDLQEMLGFDKPSKTLDWLLTKSKAAIKELVQSEQNGSGSGSGNGKSSSSSSENGADSKRKHGGKDKQTAASAALSPAKESRAKARARARERTLEKMCIKQLNAGGENHNQLDFLQLSAGSCSNNAKMSGGFCEQINNPHCFLRNEGVNQGLIEESVVMKKKSKNPLYGFQQNFVLNSHSTAPSANENWDVFGFASQSNFHAILDHHKVINSNSNI